MAMTFVVVMGLAYAYVLPAVLDADIPSLFTSGTDAARDAAARGYRSTESIMERIGEARAVPVPVPDPRHLGAGTGTGTAADAGTETAAGPPAERPAGQPAPSKAAAAAKPPGAQPADPLASRKAAAEAAPAPTVADVPDTDRDYRDRPPPTTGVRSGAVTKIIDGDTLDVEGTRVRLALVNTPERGEPGYEDASAFTRYACPEGSLAVYDVDGKQPNGPYGRVIAKVWCYGYPAGAPAASLNAMLPEHGHAEVLKKYCRTSEFAGEPWARANGC